MARIRSTKPEFYTSEQVMNLSIVARFAFQGLWVFCDDGGNHPASAKTLKAEVFPSDDITSDEVQRLIDELVSQGLLVVYEASGKQWWHVTGWHHQRIERPTFKYPKFEDSSQPTPAAIPEASAKDRGGLDDSSTSDRRALDPGVEGSGAELKEKYVAGSLPACPHAKIVDLYHDRLPDLPPIRVLESAPRQKAMRSFWSWVLTSKRSNGTLRATNSEEALAWIGEYFERASHNDFLMGRTPRSGDHANWRCDLDFLLSDKGKKQVLEKTEVAA